MSLALGYAIGHSVFSAGLSAPSTADAEFLRNYLLIISFVCPPAAGVALFVLRSRGRKVMESLRGWLDPMSLAVSLVLGLSGYVPFRLCSAIAFAF